MTVAKIATPNQRTQNATKASLLSPLDLIWSGQFPPHRK
jgi:hypothetical protein